MQNNCSLLNCLNLGDLNPLTYFLMPLNLLLLEFSVHLRSAPWNFPLQDHLKCCGIPKSLPFFTFEDIWHYCPSPFYILCVASMTPLFQANSSLCSLFLYTICCVVFFIYYFSSAYPIIILFLKLFLYLPYLLLIANFAT